VSEATWLPIVLTRSRLRPWAPEDAPSLVRHANNRNVSRNLLDHFPYPYTAADAAHWLESIVGQSPPLHLAIEIDGRAVGGIGLVPGVGNGWGTAALGYWLSEDYWGRGVMTEAAAAILAYAFDRLDLRRVDAHVFDRNVGSARVLEKIGMTLEGRLRASVVKDGEVMDQLLFARVRRANH
jgi:RimJ/RimL family protein N-acetyltransferase